MGSMENKTEQAIPVLLVTNIKKSLIWYQDLGFKEEWNHSVGRGFPVLTSLIRGGIRIFLSEYISGNPPRSIIYLMINRPESSEPAKQQLSDGLSGQQTSEITLHDPDGNRINIKYQ
jgi:hypothetical protein